MVTTTESIKVFIKGKWIIKPFSTDSVAWVYGGWPPQHEIEKFISNDDASTLKIAREVAQEWKLKLKVYDLASLRGWLSAQVNRVKTIPTIIVNTRRIEGFPSKDELLHIVEQTAKAPKP